MTLPKFNMTPTLALILAGGLAAGIGLARPAAPSSNPSEAPAAEASSPTPGYSARGQARATPRGGEPGSRAGSSGSGIGPAAVEISDFDFGEATTAATGQSITVTNNDGVAHTLTASSGGFDTGSIDGGTAVAFSAPSTPGTYDFFCTIHPSMQGRLVVQDR